MRLTKVPEPVFEAEPRERAWAEPMERSISDKIARELAARAPGTRLERVECHALSCRVTMALPSAEREAVNRAMIVVQSPQLADMTSFSRQDDADKLQVFLLFGPASRDPSTYERVQRERREAEVARLRRANAPAKYFPANSGSGSL
jgi:hypothetical protein